MKPIHVRLESEQYEWLRLYCFDHRVPQAEVVREALDIFKNKKEEEEVKKIEVVIIEAGIDYTSRLESFMMHVTGGDVVEKAIAEVEKKGYKVIPNDQGGQNEMCTVTGGSDYIAVTVEPK